MDLSVGNPVNFRISAPGQQLSESPRGNSPLSNPSQVDGGDSQGADSSKDEKAVEPSPYHIRQHDDTMPGSDGAADDVWPTSYQLPQEQTSDARQGNPTGTQGGREEAESFLSRPFERLDQLGLLTQFEQDAKEAVEFEKGAAFILF